MGTKTLSFLVCRFFRIILLVVFVVASGAIAAAPSVFGSTDTVLEVGVVFGFGVWSVAAFGVEENNTG